MNMKIKLGLALTLLVGLNVFAWGIVYDLSQPQFLEVTFFDVGQGDAIFIETSQGHQILVDGGPDSTVIKKLGAEMPFWDRSIDLIVLTHPEHDHIAGLLEVLRRYQVENILWTGILRDTAEYQEWQRLIEEEGAEIHIAKAGLSVGPGFTEIKILFPFEILEGQEIKNTNNTSVILRLDFGDNSFLLTGDAYKSIERKLLGKGIDVDILKVGHHGSKTSSAEDFIAEVSPETAVISAGRDNKYDHPHPETLETLEKYGIKVFRTDIEGDIKIITNGRTYEFPNF